MLILNRDVEDKLRSLIQKEGFELVELKVLSSRGGLILNVFIHTPGGVNLGDCTRISRKLSDFLDTEDLIQRRYTLEVSSPGLDRPLKTPSDFKRGIGENVKVFLKAPWEGKSSWSGKIQNFEEGALLLLIEGEESLRKKIPGELIDKAKIII